MGRWNSTKRTPLRRNVRDMSYHRLTRSFVIPCRALMQRCPWTIALTRGGGVHHRGPHRTVVPCLINAGMRSFTNSSVVVASCVYPRLKARNGNYVHSLRILGGFVKNSPLHLSITCSRPTRNGFGATFACLKKSVKYVF